MGEHALDVDDENVVWQLAVDGRLTQLGVADDDRVAADAQGVGDAGDQEYQADVRVAQYVAEGVEASVAEPVGDASVRSSSTFTKPAGSPFGETSAVPSSSAEAMKTKGA